MMDQDLDIVFQLQDLDSSSLLVQRNNSPGCKKIAQSGYLVSYIHERCCSSAATG